MILNLLFLALDMYIHVQLHVSLISHHAYSQNTLSHTHVDPLSLQVGPASILEVAGSIIVLDCLVDGLPAPTVTWSRDGILLPPCPARFVGQVCVTDNKYIYVQSSREEDSGVYTCQAEGVGGSMTYTVAVTILPRRGEFRKYDILSCSVGQKEDTLWISITHMLDQCHTVTLG